MVLTHTELSLAGRKGAYTRWATTDRATASQKASAAWWRRFERQVDPDGTLPAPERTRRAQAASRAFMASATLKSAQARGAAKKIATTPSKPPARPRANKQRTTTQPSSAA